MAQRTVLDEGSASTTSIEPHPDDVLLGRKANAFNHPGNQRYRHLITQNLRKYSKCKTRLNKGILTEQVTSEIVDGGRVKFLRLQESCKKKKEGGEIWKEVPYRTIQGKVAHALRDGVTKMTFPTDCDSSTAEKNTVPRINYCNEPCRVQQNLSSTFFQAKMRRDAFHKSIAMKTCLETASKPRLSSELFTLATKLKALEDEFTAKKALLVLARQRELRAKQNNDSLLLLSALGKNDQIF